MGCISRSKIANLAFALPLMLKPQLYLYMICQLKNRNIKRSAWSIVAVNFCFVVLYSMLTTDSGIKIFKQIEHLYHMSQDSLIMNCVIDQSLLATANRILNSKVVYGRYWPEIFQGKEYHFFASLQLLSSDALKLIAISASATILGTIAILYKMADRFQCFGLISFALPTLLPLFWHVHIVYLLPAYLMLASNYITNNKTKRFFLLVAISSFLLVSNFYFFGSRVADVSLSLGSNYIFSLALFILCVFDIMSGEKRCGHKLKI